MTQTAIHLVLTIGTGTAGKSSNLPQGILNTLRQAKPVAYWLVPSSSPDSIATADLIRADHPQGFQSWSESAPYRLIEAPDDLPSCRATLRDVIAAARARLPADGRLVVNPTSGTKQMSAGATLAALDEEIGEIVFTVGDRADGVVVTGTERMAGFATDQFLMERALREADMLYRSGAFLAAEKLLSRWRGRLEADRVMRVARCAHEWHRLNYRAAATAAAVFDETIRCHLDGLAGDVASGQPSERVLADLVAGADDLREWGDAEEAATRYYKSIEYAARMRICANLGVKPPFRPEHFAELRLREPVRCPPGLNQMMEILQALGDPMADGFTDSLRKALRARNESMHDIRPVEAREAQYLCDRMRNFLAPIFPLALRGRPVRRMEGLW
jgi:hypothetical protein